MNMNEEFRDVIGYEGLYQVSNLGNVKTVKTGRLRRFSTSRDGYNCLGLHKNGIRRGFAVHQLVAMSFLNHQINGHKIVVDHINTIKSDNRLENLQLMTQRQNVAKAKAKNRNLSTGVRKIGNRFVTKILINNCIIDLGRFSTEQEASNAYQNALKQLEY